MFFEWLRKLSKEAILGGVADAATELERKGMLPQSSAASVELETRLLGAPAALPLQQSPTLEVKEPGSAKARKAA